MHALATDENRNEFSDCKIWPQTPSPHTWTFFTSNRVFFAHIFQGMVNNLPISGHFYLWTYISFWSSSTLAVQLSPTGAVSRCQYRFATNTHPYSYSEIIYSINKRSFNCKWASLCLKTSLDNCNESNTSYLTKKSE